MTRTPDLLITKSRRGVNPLRQRRFQHFLLRNQPVSGPVLSVVSVRFFRRVGHGVGQALRIRLLEVKLTLRHPNHKIVLQPGRLG